MKLGGVFSGIGAFEEAARRRGWEVAWLCEIDPAARRVLEARFPGVPIYGDICELDPAEVEPVDVLTGGSPCQGFSIAGSRSGLEHVESRLFAEYVRVLEGLEGRGLRWAVWENVPGVLSIEDEHGQRTFEHVVAALVGADEPVHLRESVRWNTGLAARGSRAVSWRILDSRHFGVPQRRRRVYACVALGDTPEDRAYRALLALPEGVSRHPAACGQAGQDVAGTLGGGSGSRGWAPDTDGHSIGVLARIDRRNASRSDDSTGAGTPGTGIKEGDGPTGAVTQVPAAVLMTMREGKDGGGKGPLLAHDESLTLATGNGQVLFEPYTFDRANVTSKANRTRVGPGLPANTLAAGNDVHAVTRYGVRRLTPVEHERLQGLPDGWTEPAGSDSARYRALGNAVTMTVPLWLFGRMEEAS